MSSVGSRYMSSIAFDFDGVLFDTRRWVIHAYEAAGVDRKHVYENWGKPWMDWGYIYGYTVEHHEAKKEAYRRLVPLIKPNPAFASMLGLIKLGFTVRVLTSASMAAVLPLLEKHMDGGGIEAVETIGATGCSVRDKAEFLTKFGERGVYIDDMMFVGMEIISTAPGWELVHYHGQTDVELIEEISAWTR